MRRKKFGRSNDVFNLWELANILHLKAFLKCLLVEARFSYTLSKSVFYERELNLEASIYSIEKNLNWCFASFFSFGQYNRTQDLFLRSPFFKEREWNLQASTYWREKNVNWCFAFFFFNHYNRTQDSIKGLSRLPFFYCFLCFHALLF